MNFREIVPLIGVGIAVINILFSFFDDATRASIFSIEMDIWVYRLVWLVLAGFMFFSYLQRSKASGEN